MNIILIYLLTQAKIQTIIGQCQQKPHLAAFLKPLEAATKSKPDIKIQIKKHTFKAKDH